MSVIDTEHMLEVVPDIEAMNSAFERRLLSSRQDRLMLSRPMQLMNDVLRAQSQSTSIQSTVKPVIESLAELVENIRRCIEAKLVVVVLDGKPEVLSMVLDRDRRQAFTGQ